MNDNINDSPLLAPELKCSVGISPVIASDGEPLLENAMKMKHLLYFNDSSPIVLLYGGRMLLTAVGTSLLMVDLAPLLILPDTGLWRAFSVGSRSGKNTGSQCLLKGHTQSITQFEVLKAILNPIFFYNFILMSRSPPTSASSLLQRLLLKTE
jgi:hypothetical protein